MRACPTVRAQEFSEVAVKFLQRNLRRGQLPGWLVAIVSPEHLDAVLAFSQAHGHRAWLIGEVVKGAGTVRVL